MLAMIVFGVNITLIYLFKLTGFAQQIATKYCLHFVCLDRRPLACTEQKLCAELRLTKRSESCAFERRRWVWYGKVPWIQWELLNGGSEAEKTMCVTKESPLKRWLGNSPGKKSTLVKLRVHADSTCFLFICVIVAIPVSSFPHSSLRFIPPTLPPLFWHMQSLLTNVMTCVHSPGAVRCCPPDVSLSVRLMDILTWRHGFSKMLST